jgi:predicted enzyme related to lactoylglutathione lyase
MADVPAIFRVVLQVSNLEQAIEFYQTLLGITGRLVRGSRAYFDCGPVILVLLDPSPGGITPAPNVEEIYFSVADLEQVYERARELDCLAKENVHGEDAGRIVTRPWGERSFYAADPWSNKLCFVDEKTLFRG